MKRKLGNLVLDESNVMWNKAVDIIANSSRNIYLTGKAGTGKTTFLKFIREISDKSSIVLAPTGVAALNAGGQTIHSFFRIPFSIFTPDDIRLRFKAEKDDSDRTTIYEIFKYRRNQKNMIKGLELIIIDEVSMVRCDLLDVVDRILRAVRKRETEPFGGVQMLFIGDAFQLSPIVKNEQWEILKHYYETPFFFSSYGYRESAPDYIELDKIYRQTDKDFIDLLNKVRNNDLDANDMEMLNSRFLPSIVKNENHNYVLLATHNHLVDETNYRKLGEIEYQPVEYEAEIVGEFPEKIYPTDLILNLKVGAQVMFIRNDANRRFYNGKIGVISELAADKVSVLTEEGEIIEVKRTGWDNITYTWNKEEKKIDEEIIGTFIQFPLRLAWAITVHKSQGLSFDRIIADLRASFSPGQVYVALSRCTSLEGLVLKSKISRNVIKTDPAVISFSANCGKHELPGK